MLKLNVIKSNLEGLNGGGAYGVNLMKCIGSGSYGYIFLMDFRNYVMKILLEEEESDGITDIKEMDVVDKIIENGNLLVNNVNYAFGKISMDDDKNVLTDLDKRVRRSSYIYLHLNGKGEKELKESVISKNGKRRSFNLFQNNSVIVMPLYISFYDYLEQNSRFFKKEVILSNFMNLLVKSVEELLELGYINIDLKMNNVMIDEGNRMRIVDFGMVVRSNMIDKKMDNKVKYYIWPRNKNFTYSMVISYMISVFVMEVLYGRSVYEFCKDKTVLNLCLNDFNEIEVFSVKFKKLIMMSLIDGLEFSKFKEYFSELKCKDIPNMYHIILYNKGIKLF